MSWSMESLNNSHTPVLIICCSRLHKKTLAKLLWICYYKFRSRNDTQEWRNGRRIRLKIWRWQQCVGSSPISCMKTPWEIKGLCYLNISDYINHLSKHFRKFVKILIYVQILFTKTKCFAFCFVMNIFIQAADRAAVLLFPSFSERRMLMSTYEKFMIILTTALLIVTILDLKNK